MLKQVAICSLFAISSACSGYSPTGGAGPALLPRLLSKVEAPSDLLGVNSIFVAPPLFADQAREASSQLVWLYDQLCNSSESQLDIEASCSQELLKLSEWSSSSEASAQALKQAKQMNSDALLVTTLNQFSKREGSAIGTSTSALISFSMKVLRVADQKLLWSASYYFKDQALSENLLQAQRDFKEGRSALWQDTAEALSEGFSEALKDFSENRQKRFS